MKDAKLCLSKQKNLYRENFQTFTMSFFHSPSSTMKHPYQILTSDKEGKHLFAVVKNYLQVFNISNGEKLVNGKIQQKQIIKMFKLKNVQVDKL